MNPIYIIIQSRDGITWTVAENLQRFYQTEKAAKKRAFALNLQASAYTVKLRYKPKLYLPKHEN